MRTTLKGWLSGAKTLRDDTSPALGSPAARLSKNAVIIDPSSIFLPNRDKIEAYSTFDINDVSKKKPSGFRLRSDGLPFSRYLDTWHFHPGRIGGHLASSRMSPRLVKMAVAISQCFTVLPNGGLALYYPKSIPVARFKTHEYLYSGIAQGGLLAGYSRFIRDEIPDRRRADWRDIAFGIAKSMQFPFEKGGVCVDGKIILEAPNYRSCPETILNGWIDALLHFHDYLQIEPNRRFRKFYRENIAALVELLPSFDDPVPRLSKYSNLCPYTFRIHFDGAVRTSAPPRIAVEYTAIKPGYSNFAIADLASLGDSQACVYDNKIETFRSTYMDVSLSVDSLYDIDIHVAENCKAISFDVGTFNAKSTIPRRSGRRKSLHPHHRFDGQATTFTVRPLELGLLAGCPTNFVKNNKNSYHSYHVASLRELALTTPFADQRQAMTDFAERWSGYIAVGPTKKTRDFLDPAFFAKKITRFRVAPAGQDLDAPDSNSSFETP